MSDSIIIFVRSQKLPSVNQLRTAVSELGLTLESWEEEGIDKLEEIVGFWPGEIKGEEAGFELCAGEVDDDDLEGWEVDKASLEGRDFMFDLAFRTELDVKASAITAAVLCKMCDGLTFDDDEELTINAENCMAWADRLLSE